MQTRRALAFIFVTLLLDVLGFGIIIPVLPKLLVSLGETDLSGAAPIGGWLMFSYAAMQFIFAPILGSLSDRFGRRPVLLISLVVLSGDYLIKALAPTLAWLFIGRVMAGMAGATHATAMAFVADVSKPADRAKNFGIAGVAFGLGFIFGPALGGLLGEIGPRVPFFVAAGLALTNALYGLLILPETLPPEKRRPFRLSRANPFGAWRELKAFPLVIGLALAALMFQLAHDANPAILTYFVMLQFSWTEGDVGLLLAFVGILAALVQGVLIRWAIPKFGEAKTAVIGFTASAVGYVGFALSQQPWMLIAWSVPFALIGFIMPALRGLMSNSVPDNQQGELQGALTGLVSVTAVVAPLLMTNLFHFFTSADAPVYFPGAPYMMAGIIMLLGLGICLLTLRRFAASSR